MGPTGSPRTRPPAASCNAARLAALFLAASIPAGAGAEITPDARAVVDRYLEVTGGAGAFEAIHSMRVTGRISALGLSGTTTTWTRRPDRRANETTLGLFKLFDGFDGTAGWRTDPGSGKIVPLDGKDLEDAQTGAYFDNELWLTRDQGGGRVAVVGVDKDSAGTYTVVEVAPPVGRTRRFWFSRTSGLIDRASTKKDQLSIVSTFRDYRRAGGRLVAFQTLTRIVDMPANDLNVALDSVWVNEEIPDSRFTPAAEEAGAARYLAKEGLARLPFRYSGRHVWLRVAVNGGEPADFLYDTGASLTVIDSAFAARLGIATEGQLQGQGAGATGRASFAQLHSLRVLGADGDGVEVLGQKVAVLSLNPFLAPFFWRDCAGVLGYDFITRFVNEVDFDQRMLTLRDPKSFRYSGAGASLPFRLAGTVPAIHMRLDGRYDGEFRVDVGSGSTVDLHRPFVERHRLARKVGRTLDVMGGGFGGTFRNQLSRMRKIEIGPYGWERPIVSLSGAEGGAFTSEDYAGNIGNQILERFKCTLDYERRILYLEPGQKYREPDRFSRAGVQLGRYGETVKAIEVLPGSPAARAGLKEGDEVVSVEGKATLDYTPDDLAEILDRGEVGRAVALEVTRAGKREKLRLTLREIL